MILSLLAGLILGAISVVFIIQNTTVITINFLTYHLQSSLALVILGAMIMGLLMAAIFSIPTVIRDHLKYNSLRKQNRDLENSLKEAQSKIHTTESQNAVINKHLAENL